MPDESLLYKRLLGRELEQLRTHAGIRPTEAGDQLGRTQTSVWRFEQGKTLIDTLQLKTLLDLYGAGAAVRRRLEHLREMARQPVWWSHLGPRPPATAGLLSMERSARQIRGYDNHAIPGLLQTSAYARANIVAVAAEISRQELDDAITLRMERQAVVWNRDDPPEATFLVDEAVLYRMTGPVEVRHAQLARLRSLPPKVRLHVVPFRKGPHPSFGTYFIFNLDFDLELDLESGLTWRGVYVEGAATEEGYVTEADRDIEKYISVFERTRALALSARQSARLIEDIMKGLVEDE